MGLGGYLAARTDAELFAAERAREEREIRESLGIGGAALHDDLKKRNRLEEEAEVRHVLAPLIDRLGNQLVVSSLK